MRMVEHRREWLKGQWKHRLRQFQVGGLMIFCAAACLAADIHVVVSENAPYYAEALEHLRDHLEEQRPGLVVRVHQAGDDFRASLKATDLLVTIGAGAFLALRASEPERAALHLFISRAFWLQQQAAYPQMTGHSSIVLDQPPGRQVALARALLSDARKLAVVAGPLGVRDLDEVRARAEALDFDPVIGTLAAKDNPLRLLPPLVEAADVVVILPDSAEFNAAVARWLLQLSFRTRVPVIGFSRAYAQSGALASVYTAPEDVGHEGAARVLTWLDSGMLQGGMQYPEKYSLTTNPDVARTFGVRLPDETTGWPRLEAMLGGQE